MSRTGTPGTRAPKAPRHAKRRKVPPPPASAAAAAAGTRNEGRRRDEQAAQGLADSQLAHRTCQQRHAPAALARPLTKVRAEGERGGELLQRGGGRGRHQRRQLKPHRLRVAQFWGAEPPSPRARSHCCSPRSSAAEGTRSGSSCACAGLSAPGRSDSSADASWGRVKLLSLDREMPTESARLWST